MYDIAYGFAHTYFPLPSTERMRIEVARRGAAAVVLAKTEEELSALRIRMHTVADDLWKELLDRKRLEPLFDEAQVLDLACGCELAVHERGVE